MFDNEHSVSLLECKKIIFAGKPEALPFLQPITRILNSQGAGQIDQKPSASSDIGTLMAKGVPSFGPRFDTRTYFNYHHTAADTFDKVNPKELAEIVRSWRFWLTVWRISNRLCRAEVQGSKFKVQSWR